LGFGKLNYCTDDHKMAAVRHLGFSKIQTFNSPLSKEGHFASPGQIS